MSNESLKSITVHALKWTFLETVVSRGLQFVVGVVLARLLFPEQFGLIAMLAIFMAIAQCFLDSGFAAALIQKRDITQADKCSIFYFNIAVGVIVAGFLCLVAPWIAAFYDEPILTPLTRALSLTLVINSFGLIHNALLTKQIDFKTQTKVGLISSILSGLVGVAMAATGFGVWSLVVQQLSSTGIRTSLLWLFHSWRPALIFSIESLREMFGFGSRLLASQILSHVFDNLYYLVIGKLFTAADLGLFARAQTLGEQPSRTLSGMVGGVTFPVFSSIQDDPDRLKRVMKKALAVLALINFPIMIGMAVLARPLVLVLLTETWAGCIQYLQLICMVGLLYPLHALNLNVMTALGRSDLFLRLEIIKKVLIVINILVTWQWGIEAMIWGMIAFSCICYYLNSYYSGALIGYPMGEQLRDLSPYLIVAVLMGVGAAAAGMLPFSNVWIAFLTQLLVGIVIYVLLCRISRLDGFMEIWETGWEQWHSRNKGRQWESP
jgi:teichuronic acid exporter